MLEDDGDEARATDRIVDAQSGEIVGLVYEWHDGVKQPLWFDGQKLDVVFVVLAEQIAK